MARPPERLFPLVFESHSGRALVPSPKRSASPRATSTLQWRIGLKGLDPERRIREADISSVLWYARQVPIADFNALSFRWVLPALKIRNPRISILPPQTAEMPDIESFLA